MTASREGTPLPDSTIEAGRPTCRDTLSVGLEQALRNEGVEVTAAQLGEGTPSREALQAARQEMEAWRNGNPYWDADFERALRSAYAIDLRAGTPQDVRAAALEEAVHIARLVRIEGGSSMRRWHSDGPSLAYEDGWRIATKEIEARIRALGTSPQQQEKGKEV